MPTVPKPNGGVPCRLSSLYATCPHLFDSSRVNASSRFVCVLDALPPAVAGSVRDVHLGHNALRSLAGVEQFAACERLTLEGNPLSAWREVERLGALRRLTAVSFVGTPLASRPLYRPRALALLVDALSLPIAAFDGVPVAPQELPAARRSLRAYDATIGAALTSEWRIWGLATLRARFAVHAEILTARGALGAPPLPPDVRRVLAWWDAAGPELRPGVASAHLLPGPDVACAGSTGCFPVSLLCVMLDELESKAAAFLPSRLHHDEDAAWASAFAALASLQASVAAELQLLVHAAADSVDLARRTRASRDVAGLVSSALDAAVSAGIDRAAQAARVGAWGANMSHTLSQVSRGNAALADGISRPGAALPPPASTSRNAAFGRSASRVPAKSISLSARVVDAQRRGASRGRLSTSFPRSLSGRYGVASGTERQTPQLRESSLLPSSPAPPARRLSGLGRPAPPLLPTSPDLLPSAKMRSGDAPLQHHHSAARPTLAGNAAAAPELSRMASLVPSEADSLTCNLTGPSVTAASSAGMAATLVRLLNAVARGPHVAASARCPPSAPSYSAHVPPAPAPPARAPAPTPVSAEESRVYLLAAAAPMPATPLSVLEHELTALPAPALRTLVMALAARLADFTEANASNAAVTAERLTAFSLSLAAARDAALASESAAAEARRECFEATAAARAANARAEAAEAVVSTRRVVADSERPHAHS